MSSIITKWIGVIMLQLGICGTVIAQHSLHLKVKSLAVNHSSDTVFVAGNFNNWDPAKTRLVFSDADNSWNGVLNNIKEEVAEYKFTRGSWEKGEAGAKGSDIQNHILKLPRDTSVAYTVTSWKDDFVTPSRRHTASLQVSIMDTAFYMPQLKRKRRIWIYLPEGYAKSKKHYPVLYMQDGQNLFDEFTAGFGEWGVDEFLDSMQKMKKNGCIVIGIDNGPKRLNEYNAYSNDRFGVEEGKEYVDFLVKTLKPFIDHKYRTLSGKDNTIIAGSSMGGLISYYAAVTHPEVFGKAGIFSPSFWIAPEMGVLTDSLGSRQTGKFFFYIGELEGQQYVQDMENIMDTLGKKSNGISYSVIDPDGSHNEQAWRKWFPEFYKWMMSDGANYIIKETD